ncbi:RmlC-like cupin domain-containing protein [Chytriomyces cf. hyalinus JEL632]|nr:RmlC-like cupin domain-containing protein [Chytriomyces cf. hyalinus JEL632]
MSKLRSILATHPAHSFHGTTGTVRRLVSPNTSGHGDLLKPLVLIDHVLDADGRIISATPSSPQKGKKGAFGFGYHPHSGVATLSYQLGNALRYIDTEGQRGVLPPHGVEWMRSGGGAWHFAEVEPVSASQKTPTNFTGFQLWIALPPGVEDGSSFSQLVPPEQVPELSENQNTCTVRVLSGVYKDLVSPITDPPADQIDIFDVALKPNGAVFEHQFRDGHDSSWAVVYAGSGVVINGKTVPNNEVVLLQGGGDAVRVENTSEREDALILLGSAARHEHPLYTRNASVHTNQKSMDDAWKRIKTIGNALHAKGDI